MRGRITCFGHVQRPTGGGVRSIPPGRWVRGAWSWLTGWACVWMVARPVRCCADGAMCDGMVSSGEQWPGRSRRMVRCADSRTVAWCDVAAAAVCRSDGGRECLSRWKCLVWLRHGDCGQ